MVQGIGIVSLANYATSSLGSSGCQPSGSEFQAKQQEVGVQQTPPGSPVDQTGQTFQASIDPIETLLALVLESSSTNANTSIDQNNNSSSITISLNSGGPPQGHQADLAIQLYMDSSQNEGNSVSISINI